jgi:hypothetical protein
LVDHRLSGDRPDWLPSEAARAIAEAAGAVLTRRDSPEEARAAVRAAAVACLQSLPAPMVAEAVAPIVPADAPAPERALPELVPVEAGKLTERIGLQTIGANSPLREAERLAARLAASRAARMGSA